jgi:SAM-dependent methyltransferase
MLREYQYVLFHLLLRRPRPTHSSCARENFFASAADVRTHILADHINNQPFNTPRRRHICNTMIFRSRVFRVCALLFVALLLFRTLFFRRSSVDSTQANIFATKKPSSPHWIDTLWANRTRDDDMRRMIERLTPESRKALVHLCRLEKGSERRNKLLYDATFERYRYGAVGFSEQWLDGKCIVDDSIADDAHWLTAERVRQLIGALANFCYGENSVDALREILDYSTNRLELRGDFVDIGCGRGKMLTVACAFYDDRFGRCRGVDIIDERIDQAHALIEQTLLQAPAQWLSRLTRIEAAVADITDDRVAADLLRSASMVYMYSTCFSDSLHESIVQALLRYLRNGAQVVLHGVGSPAWQNALNKTHTFRLLRSAATGEIAWTHIDFVEKIV